MDIMCPTPPLPATRFACTLSFLICEMGAGTAFPSRVSETWHKSWSRSPGPHHPEIWDCALGQGRACGGALRCPHPADAARAHLVHTRVWGWWGGGGPRLEGPHWLVGDAARGWGLGSGLSFTSWPQVQLGTQPVKLPAGAPLLCPVGQRSSLPALFQPHPCVWSHCHELLREGGQLEPVLRGRGFPGSLPRGGDPPPEATSPRLLRGASRFYGSSSGALIAVSIVSGLSVGESGD